MAFPQIGSVSGGGRATNGTTHTITLPAGIVSGDLVLVLFGKDGVSGTVTFPAGWTNAIIDDGATAAYCVGVYRIADGAEGATIDVTTTSSEMFAWTSYRIPSASWHGTTPPEASVVVKDTTGTDTAPDPSSLTPSWGSEDTLWIAVCLNDGIETATGFPLNYTDGRADTAGHTGGCSIGTARRELAAVSEDPGAFTLSAAQEWLAVTIAVRPSAAAAGAALEGALAASAQVSASLSTSITLLGSVSAQASVSADLTTGIALQASASAQASVVGDITTSIALQASVTGEATATGVLAGLALPEGLDYQAVSDMAVRTAVSLMTVRTASHLG